MLKNDVILRFVMLLIVIGVFPKICVSQDTDLRPVSSKYIITNATVIPSPGKSISNAHVLLENGIIKAVGSDLSIPADAIEIKADSMYIYAGFISGLSHIGISTPKVEKEGEEDRTKKGNPGYKRSGITPEVSARDHLDPKQKSMADFRKLGFTMAHTVPEKGMIAGKGSVVLLGGAQGKDFIIKEDVSMYSQLSGAEGYVYPATLIGVMAQYRDIYRKAEQLKKYQASYAASSTGMERPQKNATIEALYPVVDKDLPVMFKAEKALNISRIIALQKDLGFKLMLGEVNQSWDMIPAIKAAGAPVFLSLDLPEKKKEKEEDKKEEKTDAENEEQIALEKRQKEIIDKYYAQASLMVENGISFGFSTLEVKPADLRKNLNEVVASGLSEDKALAALTTQPASILGLSNVAGTVEAGKMANLIITDKPYFEEKSNVKMVFVDGYKYEYSAAKKKKKSGSDESIDIAGTWNYVVSDTPQGDGSGVLKLEGTDGDYSGTITMSLNNSTNDLSDITLDGNMLSFSFKLNIGEEITVNVSVEVDGDSFDGQLSVAAFGSFTMEGTKEPK